jgi:hypothetical protein
VSRVRIDSVSSAAGGPVAPASRRAKIVRDGLKGLSDKQEASFQEWWRESRNHSLSRSTRPATVAGPSAKERLDALKARVAAKESIAPPLGPGL